MIDTYLTGLPTAEVMRWTLVVEHAALLDAADELIRIGAVAQRARSPLPLLEDLRILARRLGAAEHLYEREERVIYSHVELRGIFAASHALRLDHDAMRLDVKALRDLSADPGDMSFFRRELRRIRNALVPLVRDHVRREDTSLMPLALEVIGEDVWAMMKLEWDGLGEAPFQERATA